MSTKSSLTHGDSFHLYRELKTDSEDVFLQLRDVEFEASQNQLTVRIPLHVWEHVRHFGGFTPQYHEMDDEALRQHVIDEVDMRIKEWEESGRSEFVAMFGCGLFGLASDPRDQQIRIGFDALAKVRESERETLARIRALKEKHSTSVPDDKLVTARTAVRSASRCPTHHRRSAP